MNQSIIVLGAGMVGTCTALQLQARDYAVTLIDRKAPGHETSFGNAGLIQQESVEPYAFPRDPLFLLRAALGRTTEVNYHLAALPAMAKALWQYYTHSSPAAHAKATQAYSQLIAHAISEHAPLVEAVSGECLIQKQGFRFVFRTPKALNEGIERAQRLARDYEVQYQVEDSAALAKAEPAIQMPLAGAVHWQDPWAVKDPGGLTQRYADLFVARGGQLVCGDVQQLVQKGAAWQVQLCHGHIDAAQVVIAMGPWSDTCIRSLGYHFPLIIKRGYHQHYEQSTPLNQPILDAERGYVLAPMKQGLRLTTGAEFARIDAPPTPVQLAKTQALAQQLVGIGKPLDPQPWVGARPCTADMLPVMGAAPKHAGLWFNFGHGHQGFTLGPMAGKLMAQMIHGEPTLVNPAAYSPLRFVRAF